MDTKLLCLGVLSLGKASGYDIGKQLDQTFGNFIDVASSGVYPALKSLHQDGLVACEAIEQDGLPNKKMYNLTPEGQETFKKALSELPPRHKVRSQFILLLFFANELSEKRLNEILHERKAELEHWIELTRTWLEHNSGGQNGQGRHFIARYASEIMETELQFIENNSDQLLKSLNDCEQGAST